MKEETKMHRYIYPANGRSVQTLVGTDPADAVNHARIMTDYPMHGMDYWPLQAIAIKVVPQPRTTLDQELGLTPRDLICVSAVRRADGQSITLILREVI